MPRLFAKREESASAEPPALPPITSEDLKAQLGQIKGQIASLARERDKYSLASLRGDDKARGAIEMIDRERQRLAAQQETVEAALRQLQQVEPQQREYLRRRGNFLRNKPGWVLHLQQHVPEEYGRLAAHLILLRSEGRTGETDLHWQGGNRQDDPVGVTNIARHLARQLCEPLCKTRRAHPTGDPNRTAYRDEVDVALRDEFTEELLKEADLPECPGTIEEFVRRWS